MINSNDTSMKISNNYGILTKIKSFFKKLLGKDNIKYISVGSSDNSNNRKNSDFSKSIKFEEDPDKAMLLKIQDDFEKMGISKQNADILTKNLTDVQKRKLEELYREQIRDYQVSISNYKNKIVTIRKKLV